MDKQVKVVSPVDLLQYRHLHDRDSLPRLTTHRCSQGSVNRQPRDTFHNRSSKCLYLVVIFSLIFTQILNSRISLFVAIFPSHAFGSKHFTKFRTKCADSFYPVHKTWFVGNFKSSQIH